MKKSIFLITLLFISIISFSQQELIVKKGARGLYLLHTVTPKETFYSVGRLYNVPAKEIALYNNLEMTQGLTIGKTINVPLTSNNFTQEKTTSKPVLYVVGQKEGLFRVSATNNNVLMANLRKWNNLANDNINTGQKLIVGYLVTDPAAVSAPAPVSVTTVTEKQPEPVKQVVEPKAELVVEKKKEEPKVVQEKKLERKEPVKATTAAITTPSNDGYFKSQYQLQVRSQPESREETITAGIFKTASGWQDGKYYVLLDDVEPGTIVKVINPNNNKTVYAKVLDKMSGIRQNQGFDLRMSNAAAVALDIPDTDKFFVKLVY